MERFWGSHRRGKLSVGGPPLHWITFREEQNQKVRGVPDQDIRLAENAYRGVSEKGWGGGGGGKFKNFQREPYVQNLSSGRKKIKQEVGGLTGFNGGGNLIHWGNNAWGEKAEISGVDRRGGNCLRSGETFEV